MGLAGELKTIGLAEVFQNLAFNNLTGTLFIKQGARKASIRFEEGKVRAVHVPGQELDYVQIARKAQVAPDEVVAKASNVSLRRTLKAFLHAAGNFDEARWDATVASYVQETILPLFGWTRGSFTFDEGRMKQRDFDKEQMACNIEIDPMAIAMEAARRHDEWDTVQEYIPAENEILVLWSYPAEELNAEHERILALLDGTRDYAAVVKEAPLRKYDAQKAIANWLQAGHVVPATPELLRDMAAQARATGDVNLAVRRLELALEMDQGDLEARRELVRLYERAGRKTDAAREQAAMARLQADRGDLQGALESYERARVLEPRNLDTLERIFQLHEAKGDRVEAVRTGRRLAEALVAQEMFEDALPLYERLLKQDSRHTALREALAKCLIQLNEPKKAAEHLMVLGSRAYEKKNFKAALKHFQGAVAADPKNKRAAERVEEIESGVAENRVARRRKRMYVAIAAVVLGLALWQLAREWYAQGALHLTHLNATGRLSKDNSYRARIDALGRYAEVCRDHRFTRSAAQATETVHTMLLAEVALIDKHLERAWEAESTAQVEMNLGVAEKTLNAIDAIELPIGVQEYWQGARETLRKRVSELQAK